MRMELSRIQARPGRRLGGAVRTALMAAALASAGVSTLAQGATLTTYDNFSASSINPRLWQGEEGRGAGGNRTEVRRAVVSGQLRMEARSYGNAARNVGASSARNALNFSRSTAITGMGATLTVRTATVTACAGNTDAYTTARARLFGFFFNAGAPAIGSLYNDVFAGIQVERQSNSTDPAGVLRVVAFVNVCTDDSCIASRNLGFRDMGTVNIGTPVALQLAWNKSANQFEFMRDATTANLTYTVADTQPASFPGKRLEIGNQMAHCTASQQSVFTAADFDNVKTNALPAALANEVPMAMPTEGEEPAFDGAVGGVR